MDEFIEQFYADFEQGMASAGKKYVRPADYKERAMRVIFKILERKRLGRKEWRR